MAEPLPAGWVDTGTTLTVSMSGECAVMMARDNANLRQATIGDWSLTGTIATFIDPFCPVGIPGTRSSGRHYAYVRWLYRNLESPAGASTDAEVESHAITCEEYSSIGSVMSDWYGLSQQVGPYRLGVKLQIIEGREDNAPLFASDYELVYGWFQDENTRRESTFAGQSAPTLYSVGTGWGLTQVTGQTPALAEPVAPLGFSATANATNLDSSTVQVQFRNLSVSGSTVDTTGLSSGVLLGTGGGSAQAKGTGTGSGEQGPSYVLDYDVDLPGFGTADSSGAQVATTLRGTRTAPYAATVEWPVCSWRSSEAIPGAYESLSHAAATELYPVADAPILIWAAPARQSPSTAPQEYKPLTISLAETIDVFRPHGGRPSDFTSSDTGKIVVAEGDEHTTVTVSGSGAYIRRQFGASGTDTPEWRPWLGVGASGKGDAAFHPDKAEQTKSVSGDVFDWTSYRHLRVSLNTVTGTASGLKLIVEGVQLSISDPHTTGSDRTDGFTVTETPYTKTYTLPTFAPGADTSEVDLCFPDEGGPYYHGRIDAVKITGWSAGNYLLTGLDLVSKAPKTVWLKSGFGGPVQRGDYSALHASHNGANPTLNLGDQANKPEEIGTYGGALRYVYILTGSGTGTILDEQLSLEAYGTLLHGLEGWTATWSQSAHDAANEDTYGNSLSGGIAQWMRQQHADFNAGSNHQPACHPHVGRLYPVPGKTFAIYTRQWVGGAVDAILSTGRRPVADTAASYDGESATSDAHGYIQWYPVDAGTALTGHGGLLTPRDKVRVLVTVPGDEASPYGGVDLLQQAHTGWWFRASRLEGAVTVERSLTAGATWETAVTLPYGAQESENAETLGAAPTLVRDPWDVLWCWAHDADGAAQAYYTRNGGVTWEHWVTHAGLQYPRAVRTWERLLLAGWQAGNLVFFTSDDNGRTLSAVPALSLGVPRQLCALRVDRQNTVHLLYSDGSSLQHRYLRGDLTWSDAVTLGGGVRPAAGLDYPGACLIYWDGDALAGSYTNEVLTALRGTITTPAGTWAADYLGVEVGQHWATHGTWYLVGWDSAAESLQTRYSRDSGQTWETPV